MLKLRAKSGNVRLYDLKASISYLRWTTIDDKQALRSKDLKNNVHKLRIETNNDAIKKYLGIPTSKAVNTITTKTNNVVINEQNKIYVAQVPEEQKVEPFVYKPEHDIIYTGEDITANNLINEIKEDIEVKSNNAVETSKSQTIDKFEKSSESSGNKITNNEPITKERKKPGRKPKNLTVSNSDDTSITTNPPVKERKKPGPKPKNPAPSIINNEEVNVLSDILNATK